MQEYIKYKLSDKELLSLIEKRIEDGDYVFTHHSKIRQRERLISDLEVLGILEGKIGCRRKRNKKKDTYNTIAGNWKYCIEGVNFDKRAIRIIITFTENMMPIITVMWI